MEWVQQSISEKNKGEINERKLFHGTRYKNPAEICECGFGDSTKEIFGDRLGVFFAVVAKYAAKKYAYAVDKDHGQVFLAKVITGRSYRLPIQEQGTEEDMDESPTDSRIKGSPDNGDEVYGTFESNRAYPAYLITYKDVRGRTRMQADTNTES